MFRFAAIPLVLAALVIGSLWWSGGVRTEVRADFAFINRGDNKCLDPAGMSWMQDVRLSYALWEGLYTLDPVNLKPIPGTADRIQVDRQTHTIWTFHIRDDARWSNGDPVRAQDFIFEWRRFLETPGEYSYLHHYIRGAKQYEDDFAKYVAARSNGDASARPPDFSTVGEEALDDHTLRVTLTNPVPFFPALCAYAPFFPMNERSMRDFAHTDPVTGVTTYDQAFTRAPHLVTNGPYKMIEWTFKRRIRLAASKYYWDRAHVKCRVIDQISCDDPLAAFRMYADGDVDWLTDVDFDLAAALRKQHRPDLHIFPAFGTYYYVFNCLPTLPEGEQNPLHDRRVRQALAMSIDKRIIVRDVGRLGQPIANDLIPPGIFEGYQSPPGLVYDVSAAQRLLADAGYPGGKGFPHLTIFYNNEADNPDIAQVIRRQWLTNLHIDLDLEGVEVKTFGERLHDQKFDVARSSWYGDYDDPSTFTDLFKSDSDENNARWASARYDELCGEAAREADVGKRLKLLSTAEGLMLDSAPIVPLFNPVNIYMFRENVKGIPLDPRALVMFQSVQIKKGT